MSLISISPISIYIHHNILILILLLPSHSMICISIGFYVMPHSLSFPFWYPQFLSCNKISVTYIYLLSCNSLHVL